MADYDEEFPNEENDLRIIHDNLSRIDRQRGEETEKRLSHLKDAARLLERRISQCGIKREHQPPSGAPLRFETLFDGSCPQPCEAFRILCSIVHSAKVEEMSPRCLPASGKQWISG